MHRRHARCKKGALQGSIRGRETEEEGGEASALRALARQERPEEGSISPRVGLLERDLRSGLRFRGPIVCIHEQWAAFKRIDGSGECTHKIVQIKF
jgi:hypothetical protein